MLDIISNLPVIAIVLSTTVAAFLYVARQMSSDVVIIPPSPNIEFQSTVIDIKTGLRTSTTKIECEASCDLKNVYDVFLKGLQVSRKKSCFGRRKSFDEPVTWTTYEQVHEQILNCGSGLKTLSKKENEGVGVFARNSSEWIIVEYTCAAYLFIVVPLYNTLGDDALVSILNEVELQIIFCDTTTNAKKIWKLANSKMQHLILFERDAEFDEFKSEVKDQTQVLTFKELLEIGQQNRVKPREAKKEDLFLICYTSGSTGAPKGVMMTHEKFSNTALAGKLHRKAGTMQYIQPVHLSYLPLAHIMEQILVAKTLLDGGRIGFMTSTVAELKKDYQCYRPFTLCAVPRIILRIYSDYTRRFHTNFIKRWISDYLIDRRIEEQKKGIYRRGGFVDRMLFGNIREQFGGQVMFVVTGSAPIAGYVLRFVRVAFACPVIQGYGSTETGGSVSCTLVGDVDDSHVGALMPGCRVRLADVPEMDIVVSRDGMGEICVLTNTVTVGYYKKPEMTKNLIDKDGYIHTGDIGTWLPNGALKLVDRCKDLFKLSQGEYVSPERVERVYGLCNLVYQIFVEGNPLQSYCVAILVPNFKELGQEMFKLFASRQWNSSKSGVYEPSVKRDICRNPTVRQHILESINKIGKEHGLKGFEMVKAIHLSPDSFTVENGELTPTLKFARPKIRLHYSEKIAALYKQ